MIQEFLVGLTAPFRALKLIAIKPKLLILSIMPVMITLAALSFSIYAILAGTSALIQSTISNFLGAQFGGYLGTATQFIIAALLIFTGFQMVTFVINLLSIPFNDLLAEQTERAIGIAPSPRSGFGYYFRVMSLDIGKTVLNVALLVAFTIGTWIPVVGLVSFVGIALLNTLNYISYPQSRRLMGVSDSFMWIKKNGPRSLGFGIATTFLFSIPVINFFALPLSVVGGTLIYLENPTRY